LKGNLNYPKHVTKLLHVLTPSGRTMALRSTQSLNRNEYQAYLLWVKAAGAYGRQPSTFMCRLSVNSGSLNLLEP